jgi:hypothetical protein
MNARQARKLLQYHEQLSGTMPVHQVFTPFIEKMIANAEWKQLIPENKTEGAVYICRVSTNKAQLDIIAASYNKIVSDQGVITYTPSHFRVIVAEDNLLVAGYDNDLQNPAPIRELYEAASYNCDPNKNSYLSTAEQR